MNPWLLQHGRVPLKLLVAGDSPTRKVKEPDTTDARIAELRKRYKKVQGESGGSLKGPVDLNWF